MKKFIRLLNFEMNRFAKFILPTTIVVVILQLISTITAINAYNRQVNDLLTRQPGDLDNVMQTLGSFSFQNIISSSVFYLSLFAIIILFIFYSFYSWYREWLGKNTFAYRLLMLPMNRISIFFSKALVFIIAGLFFFGLQHFLLYLWRFVAELMIANRFLLDLNVYDAFNFDFFYATMLFPDSFIEFLSTYGFALGALLSLFTGIILERSFGWKGLIIGSLYFITYIVICFLSVSLGYATIFNITMRPSSAFILQQIFVVLSLIISSMISGYLLSHKIKI